MADITVVYLSEDEETVGRLVDILRARWNSWWAKDIAVGDWEDAVRTEIDNSSALVPVLSNHAKGDRRAILKDEIAYARSKEKFIFPFVIGGADVPFGLGGLNHTKALDWSGDPRHPGCQELLKKIASKISPTRAGSESALKRPESMTVRGKSLRLPAFAFSLSSHETQVKPKDGMQLMELLQPNACLLSAYDQWKHYRRDSAFHKRVKSVRQTPCVVYLDSGNYEAYRKADRYSKKNPTGWQRDHFLEAARRLPADLVFSFDNVGVDGTLQSVVRRIVSDFQRDERSLTKCDFDLCPIVHLPQSKRGTRPTDAPQMLSQIAVELSPVMLAIPERELGDGLLERVRTVKAIRKELNSLGRYYPLHLLGTGNPLSMIALAAAGADSFDGLEWCRTMSDYENGYLFHFQHFEFFGAACLSRVKDPRVRAILEDGKAPYSVKVSCFNIESFNDWTKTMQDMIHAGHEEHLLKMIPNIGPVIYSELKR